MSVGQFQEVSQPPVTPTATLDAETSKWIKCPRDGAFIFHKRWERNLKVCPECNYHFRIGARERLEFLIDPGSFQGMDDDIEPCDPLGFVDSKPYLARIREAQQKTGQKEGAIYGTAQLGGTPLVVAVMSFGFVGGAMGSAVGEVITQAIEHATASRLPLLTICASGGARMQEGCISLMQMAKTSAALAILGERALPHFVVLTDPTYGGVTASFAMLGDILIAEPDAMIGFAGRSIVESTIKQKLPPEFQRSDFLLEHGMVDMVVSRSELRGTIGKLLASHAAAIAAQRQSASALPEVDAIGPARATESPRDAWEVVQLARHQGRPNTREYIKEIFDDFHPLYGDRLYREDGAIVGGLARLGDLHCVVIGTQKGRSIKENLACNFGMPHPEGYRKALRLMRHAAKFGMPILTFVDTSGAYPGVGGEERGQAIAIARNLLEMSRLPVPIVTMLTGEGGSGGALALAVADHILMLENAYYSVISPEGCSMILFKNVAAAPRAAQSLRITAHELKRLGVIDSIVPEPPGGAHNDVAGMALTLKSQIVHALRQLLPRDPEELIKDRYERYRRFGARPMGPVAHPGEGEPKSDN